MNKTTEAIDFYNQLSDLYLEKNEIEKTNETKLEIAQIYKSTYKFNHARIIYEKFTNYLYISFNVQDSELSYQQKHLL